MTKFFIDQHGCAKNQVDGELLIGYLLDAGYEQTFAPEQADVIIINSCGFIESAKKESIDALCAAKKSYPNAKIVLAGCLAERYAQTFKDALPEADGIFGNGNLEKINETVQAVLEGNRPVDVYKQEGICTGERRVMLSYRGSAFVKITEGCSNHCSFCAIPVIRGELRSRPAKSIVSEIESLLAQGIVEFNLIGQDLAAYGTGENDNVFGNGRAELPLWIGGKNCGTKNKSALALLLEKILKIKKNFIVRLLYIHPDHFNRDILPIMQKDARIVPYFDIPFQSGDEEIIRKMNRKGSAEEYLKLASDIRGALPNAVLRTTFLAGFPGETEQNAENTLDFLKKLQSDWSGCFPYSREEDTPAYSMKNRVSAKVSKARAEKLTSEQEKITEQHLKKYIGKEFDVLIEEIVEGEEGLAIGRAWFQAPDVDGSVVVRYQKDSKTENDLVKLGRFVRVKICSSSAVDLDGILVSDSNFSNDFINNSELVFAPEVQ